MSNVAQTIPGSGSIELKIVGNFLRLMNSTGAVEIVYYRNGAEIARTGSVLAGYAERIDAGFESVIITDKSGAANAIEFVYRQSGNVSYDRSAGAVTVTNLNGPAVNAAGTVGVASAVLVAAVAARRYLLIQNKHATAKIYISFGAAATVANGILIAPGGSYSADSSFCPNNDVHAISDTAATNVAVVTG